jgi:hypothetical protein
LLILFSNGTKWSETVVIDERSVSVVRQLLLSTGYRTKRSGVRLFLLFLLLLLLISIIEYLGRTKRSVVRQLFHDFDGYSKNANDNYNAIIRPL